MGPNGSGKSTLAQVLAGHPAYQVTSGQVLYQGQDLLEMEPEERAQAGIFLAFQYPVEIPGISNAYFLRAAYNEIRKARGLEEVDSMDFLDLLEEKLRLVEWGPEIMSRAVNSGFSGGEKKRNEILQMAVLDPKLAVLDETDSGSISMPYEPWPTGSMRCGDQTMRQSSSPTISACSITSSPTGFTCCRPAEL
jgi:Fe-S cluster assembly ATP-binding protein